LQRAYDGLESKSPFSEKSFGKKSESQWENLYYFIVAAYIYRSSRLFLGLASQEIRIAFTLKSAERFIVAMESRGG